MLSGTSPSAVLSLSIFLSPSSDTTKITVTDWKIVPGRAVSAQHIRITEPRDGWGWKGPLVQKKKQVLVSAGSVFFWLPAAQTTQDINGTTEIMAGHFAVGRNFTHVNFARRPRDRI